MPGLIPEKPGPDDGSLAAAPLIRLRNIHFSHPGGPPLLAGLDLDLYPGERVGLLGPNGCGKTTLLHLIMGLLTPGAGTVEILGRLRRTETDFQDAYRHVGLLFQDADDQLFCPTVLEDVAFGPLNLGMDRKKALDAARSALSALGMEKLEHHVTHRLSGGEKRMVALATVLAMSPRALLLDEPSAGLDQAAWDRLIHVLRHLDIACVIISHESEFMTAVTHRMHLMERGRIRLDTGVRRDIHAHGAGNRPGEY